MRNPVGSVWMKRATWLLLVLAWSGRAQADTTLILGAPTRAGTVSVTMVGSRWKKSSSLDCTSSNVQCRWLSINPGITVLPAASIVVVSGAAWATASAPSAAIRPSTSNSG